ncbi:hypothetical protein NKG05_12040 [Oerskovia sp. M15]
MSSLLVENAEGVSVDRRLGSRMHVRVAGDLVPAVVVDDVSVAYDGTLNPSPRVTRPSRSRSRTTATRAWPPARPCASRAVGAGRRARRASSSRDAPGTSVTRTVTVDGVWPSAGSRRT